MKAMFVKWLRALKLDTLLLGLIEKLVLGLVKKIPSLQTSVRETLETLSFSA